MSSTGLLMVVASAVILVGQTMVLSLPDVREVYFHCGFEDDVHSDDQSLIDSLAKDLIRHTPQYSFNHYDEIELGLLNVYGHGMCNTPMAFQDCISCLRVANTRRLLHCKYVKGFEMKLKDCYMRIEEYEFKYDPAIVIP